MRKLSALLVAAFSLCSTSLAAARAPDTFEEDYHPPVVIDSPMWVTWEFRFGQYTPDTGAFRDAFPSDKGWLYGAEVDLTAYKIPYVGQLAGGLGFGWAKYSAKASVIPGGQASGETTKLTLFPVSALAVLRIDGLARHTKVPLTFAAKLGADFLRWKASTGSNNDGAGLNIGLHWALQGALELDFIDRRSSRRLDDDFGINHTFIFGELMESKTEALGDRTFQFGLGAQF
jgi:hypothetical protein